MSSKNELENGDLDKLLLKFSIPATLSTLVVVIQGITDRYFIGKYIGITGMEATSILFPLIIVISGLSSLLSVGGGNLYAINLGKRKKFLAKKTYYLTILLGLLVGILYSSLILLFSKHILNFLGATANTYKHIQNYNLGTTPFSVFQILFIILITFLRINNKPNLSMIYGIINISLNIILNYLLIVIFDWGIFGAGISTSLSSVILVIIMIKNFKKDKMLYINFKKLKINIEDSKKIIKIGSGSFISQLLNSLTIVLMNKQLLKYGNIFSIPSFSVISMGRTVINLITTGIVQGRAPILSYNFGAKQFERVISLTKKSILYSVFISVLCTILLISFGWKFSEFFIKNNLELISITVRNMKLHLTFMFSTTIYLITSSYFQGIGEGKTTFNLAIFRLLIIFIPMLIILPLYFQEVGVWIAFPISETISAIVSYRLMNKSLRKLI